MNTSERHKAMQSSCKLVLFLCAVLTDHTGFLGTNLYLLNLPINMHYQYEPEDMNLKELCHEIQSN